MEQYGIFALVYSFFLFIAGFHNALLLEPMSVLGPAQHKLHLKKYFGILLWIHAGVTLAAAVLFFLAGGTLLLIHRSHLLSTALFGVGISLPCILLLWLLRRAFYVEHNPKGALIGNFLYGLCLIGALVVFQGFSILSLLSVFFIIGIASLVASSASFAQLKFQYEKNYSIIKPQIKDVLSENWIYGRWVVAITVTHWLSGNIYYVFTASFLSLEETGIFRAMHNLVMPMSHFATALGLLFLPKISERLADKGISSLKKDVIRVTFAIVVFAGLYFFAISLLSHTVVSLLYGDKYSQAAWLIPFLAFAPFVAALGSGLQTGLRALQKPQALFAASCVSAVVTVLLGAALVHFWGLAGAAIGGIVSHTFQLPVLIWYWKNLASKNDEWMLAKAL